MNNKSKIEIVRQILIDLGENFKTKKLAKPQEIEKIEHKLEVSFPNEYKEFLQNFGWISIGEIAEIADLGSNLEETLQLREGYGDKFSKNLVPLHDDGFGNYHCLVCGGKDNGKVIFWQHDVYEGQEYHNIPPGKLEDFWIEASDFWTWLLERLEEKYKEKEEKKKHLK